MGTFPECEVKLCDFEISRVILEGTEVREILGTPDYVGKHAVFLQTTSFPRSYRSCHLTNKKYYMCVCVCAKETGCESHPSRFLSIFDYTYK